MNSVFGLKQFPIILDCFSVTANTHHDQKQKSVPGVGCCISGSDHVLLEDWGSVWNLSWKRHGCSAGARKNGEKMQTMEAWLVKSHKEADSTRS